MINMKSKAVLDEQNIHYDGYHKLKTNPRYEKAWKYVTKNLRKNVKILDIGCADGSFSSYLVSKGYSCYGLEGNPKAILQAKSKGIIVKEGSFLEKFPFKNETFDFIFAGEVIEHTINDDFFLSEINRVLKKKGDVFITAPNLVSLSNRLLMLFGRLPRFVFSPFHYKIYTPSLLRKKIVKSKFKIISFSSSYIIVSKYFNKILGAIGERMGSIVPRFGEHLIFHARKK